MNNNRNNNRRRGGNRNRNQSGGGGNPMQANRIDNRARGNAPQMLDKYKKLAQDAQHHDDPVQAEYYLQFADHYFRVIADNKARQDEARAKRDGPERQSGRCSRAAARTIESQNRNNDDDGGDRTRTVPRTIGIVPQIATTTRPRAANRAAPAMIATMTATEMSRVRRRVVARAGMMATIAPPANPALRAPQNRRATRTIAAAKRAKSMHRSCRPPSAIPTMASLRPSRAASPPSAVARPTMAVVQAKPPKPSARRVFVRSCINA